MGCGMSRGRYPYAVDDIPYHQGVMYQQASPLQPMGSRCGRGRGRGCHRRGGPYRRGCGRGPPWRAGYGYPQQGMAYDSPPQGFASGGPKLEEYRESSMEEKFKPPMRGGGGEVYTDRVESGPPRYSKISVLKN